MNEFHIDYTPICKVYAQEALTGTLYLAIRDVPSLLEKYLNRQNQQMIKALDFGCGTGVSTRYLKSLDQRFIVDGVDISLDMLKLAGEADPKGNYRWIQHEKIPAPPDSYDLIFSTFVLFEFATKRKMQSALEEIKRVMKKEALFIAVTGSTETYNRNNHWVSLDGDFPQNDHLKSGDIGRIDFLVNMIKTQSPFKIIIGQKKIIKKSLRRLGFS